MLLIRAMIAAANADGEITPDERQMITGKLDQAGAGPDERAVLERELAEPALGRPDRRARSTTRRPPRRSTSPPASR